MIHLIVIPAFWKYAIYMNRLVVLRRSTQLGFFLFILLIPVFDILRYDVAARELYMFGSVWSLGLHEGFYADASVRGAAHVAVQFFLNAVLPWIIVLSVFPLMGYLFGRLFCGWFCPEGAMFELADFFTLKILGRRSFFIKLPNDPPVKPGSRIGRVFYGAALLAVLLVVPPITGLFLAGYFVAPAEVWRQVMTMDFSRGVISGMIGVSIYMTLSFTLIRHVFCKYVCAAGLMQMLFGWISPLSLRIRFDRSDLARCTDCKRCEEVCFMNVKPRSSTRDINCVNCTACISACDEELAGNGLFSLRMGEEELRSSCFPHTKEAVRRA